jgi:fido (protein-threonine AMPylation protein)
MILVEPYADNQSEINPGQYKTLPNYLYSTIGERIDFVAPEEVTEKMNSLVNWLNNHISPPKRKKRQYDKHPLLIATIFHLEFINIHPFGDGNGRMARILMNLIFMLTGYTPAIIKLEKREDYYANLNLSSAENATPFATYLGEALIESLTLAIKAAKGELIEDKDDLDKQIDLLYREISPENILKEKATSLNVSNIIEKNIFPLLMALEEKCSKLHNLFFDFDRNMQFNYKDSQSLKSLGTKESIWKDIIENWLYNQIIKQQQLLTEFTYSYVLKGLKKSIKGNSIDFKIDIYFKDYTYLIIDSRNEYEYPYDKILTESEIKNIITPIVTKLIERIRQYSTND